ncbi:DUF488 domain-containing protein [Eoetvoesiella caeni]|uniref:Uncharacterized protein YeaO (DUF488 family) n=1 Tax=Eoetvoesiella caeni TaxID=645616 RepID=A0A366HFC0_9BURK|nr:DUF488 family protein [Eoetvoesiella caeni]MCI2808795.1 DUF488 family protein [Eoetvoesiella caeni]NYT55335.1 DUF488 family protein [Eoetvoesiella caeni]RBP40683.1 uncharacterized protein YeaO (DUF488 family) [Eoetvoesiella caeni]
MVKHVQIRRAYEAPDAGDGFRVFVDRLWPRGLSKEDFKFDLWCKDLAPSPALRTWFGHKVEHWEGFQENYQQELRTPEQRKLMREVAEQADGATITLVYGAKDTQHNHALILADEMNRVLKTKPRKS